MGSNIVARNHRAYYGDTFYVQEGEVGGWLFSDGEEIIIRDSEFADELISLLTALRNDLVMDGK